MGQLTHSVVNAVPTTFTFGALTRAAGRWSLGCFPEAMAYQTWRHHAPGSTGNIVVTGGRMGGDVIALARYVDTMANLQTTLPGDRVAMENQALTVTDSLGTAFTRCRLINGGWKIVRKPVGMFVGGTLMAMVDVLFQFTVDS